MQSAFDRGASVIQSKANSLDWMKNIQPQTKDKVGGWQHVQSQESLLVVELPAHPLVDELMKQTGWVRRGNHC